MRCDRFAQHASHTSRLGEIYLSWYYHEQNYHLDEYFLEHECHGSAGTSMAKRRGKGKVKESC